MRNHLKRLWNGTLLVGVIVACAHGISLVVNTLTSLGYLLGGIGLVLSLGGAWIIGVIDEEDRGL